MRIKSFVKNHPLFILLLIGLLLRIGLIFLDYSWDVHNHITWAKDLWKRGFTDFYDLRSSEVFATPYPNYPPLSLLTFYVFYPIQSVIEKIIWSLNVAFPLFPSKLVFFVESRSFLAAMLKLPAIFADLGVAWLCYLFTLRLSSGLAKKTNPKNLKASRLIAMLILFNPAFFYNSAYWGQIDVIPIFFALLSIYLLLFTKKFLLSALSFTLALLCKPTVLVYLPIYTIFFVNKFSFKKSVIAIFLSLLFFWSSFIFFTQDKTNIFLPFTMYSDKILATQSLPFVTNGAFNFWVLVTRFEGIKDTSQFLFGLSYRIWGYLIVGIIYSIIVYNVLRKKFNLQIFLYALFISAFASFLFLTKMHERYSILPLPFILLLTLKNKSFVKWFILLSCTSFLNLYHSWPVPRVELLVNILFYPPVAVVLSLINIMLFLYFLRNYIMFSVNKNERL